MTTRPRPGVAPPPSRPPGQVRAAAQATVPQAPGRPGGATPGATTAARAVNMHEECCELLAAVRDALDTPGVRRAEIASAIRIVLDGDGTPDDVALVLRRFAANRRSGRPPARKAGLR